MLLATSTQSGNVSITGKLALNNGVTAASVQYTVDPGPPAAINGVTITPAVVQSITTGGTTEPTITGTVLDAYGNPVTNASVSITGGWNPGVPTSATTNSQGVFSASLLPRVAGTDYHPTIVVHSASGNFSQTAGSASLTVIAQRYVLTLRSMNGSQSTPAGTPYGVSAVLMQNNGTGLTPAANQSVTFTVTGTDTGYWTASPTVPTLASAHTITVTTNSEGVANAEVALEPNTGSQTLSAQVTALKQSTTLLVHVTNNTPSQITTEQLAGYPASVPPYFQEDYTDTNWNFKDTVDRELVTVFVAKDRYGFPVANGEPVNFSIDNLNNLKDGGPTSIGYGSNGTDGCGDGSYVWYGGNDYPTQTGTFYPRITVDGVTFTGTDASSQPLVVVPDTLVYGAPTIPIFTHGTTLASGWSATSPAISYAAGTQGGPKALGGWINGQNSVTYTFRVISGTPTIGYGLAQGAYQNNAPVHIQLNGTSVATITSDVGPDGSTMSSNAVLWSRTLSPGVYRLTLSGSMFNIYGLWTNDPQGIQPGN